MFSLLIRSYNNLCWVGDPQERQNAHQAASPDLLMMVKDMMWATKKKYQISTLVASSYYKFVFTSPSSCWGVEWAPGAACDNLCHLFQMSRNEIALKIFQISFWPRICILLPPFCWTLHVLGRSKGSNFAWMLHCLILSIFPSSFCINPGRMGSVWHQESWVLHVTSSKLSGRGIDLIKE